VKLAGDILESDQGPARKAVGAGHPRHLSCFLQVLKFPPANHCGRFASLLGESDQRTPHKGLKLTHEVYRPDFGAVGRAGGAEQAQLARELKKGNLRFYSGGIIFPEPPQLRWKQVGSSSNAIELLNGRLNGDTARSNSFGDRCIDFGKRS
jgi:hypothetical protein